MMPFALLFIGILLIVVGFQNTYAQFGTLVEGDFSGSNSFLWFLVAIGAVGSLGYVKPLEGFSRAFMALIVIGLFIGAVNKGGFFNNLTGGINAGDTAAVNPVGAALPSSGSSVSSGGSSSSLLSTGIEAAAASFL